MFALAGGVVARLRPLGQMALGVLYPPACLHCGADVARHGLLCSACFARLHGVVAPFCKACAVPQVSAGMLGADGLCPACERHHSAWGQARAAFVYESVARELILKLKYADQTDNAAFLAQQMVRVGRDILVDDALVVPVPVHRWRLFRRRYNQAALLAHAVAKLAGLRCLPDALVRVRSTVPLASFSRQARWDEVAQAIMLRSSCGPRVRGRDIVVVDDLLTTGATAAACTNALLQGGARSVSLLVAGVVPPRRDVDMDQPDYGHVG
ncbi:double zinc ribbon domain-containing protein [Acetobacter lambici]|uniref:Double zinc ribbon domain-containing protein n=1 Tax=Acetobacter lambici TaxID=1332824 RepID=A0ABT1EVX9_9PROT|nr:double zinc ribbon domain-containing protein [Acetobacter lambici]MCP1257106.1 double zinc ribbon domain-containing protein [Acetobacter lambici]